MLTPTSFRVDYKRETTGAVFQRNVRFNVDINLASSYSSQETTNCQTKGSNELVNTPPPVSTSSNTSNTTRPSSEQSFGVPVLKQLSSNCGHLALLGKNLSSFGNNLVNLCGNYPFQNKNAFKANNAPKDRNPKRVQNVSNTTNSAPNVIPTNPSSQTSPQDANSHCFTYTQKETEPSPCSIDSQKINATTAKPMFYVITFTLVSGPVRRFKRICDSVQSNMHNRPPRTVNKDTSQIATAPSLPPVPQMSLESNESGPVASSIGSGCNSKVPSPRKLSECGPTLSVECSSTYGDKVYATHQLLDVCGSSRSSQTGVSFEAGSDSFECESSAKSCPTASGDSLSLCVKRTPSHRKHSNVSDCGSLGEEDSRSCGSTALEARLRGSVASLNGPLSSGSYLGKKIMQLSRCKSEQPPPMCSLAFNEPAFKEFAKEAKLISNNSASSVSTSSKSALKMLINNGRSKNLDANLFGE